MRRTTTTTTTTVRAPRREVAAVERDTMQATATTMTTPPSTLRHLAFFEALATGDERAQAEWAATSAGLVVLRLVDAWLEEGAVVSAADGWSIRAAEEAVEAVHAGTPARAILAGIVDVISRSARPDVALVAPRLMAYGRALDFEGRWHLAADVYRTVVAHAHPSSEADVAIDANMQLGACERRLGNLNDAEVAYAKAERIAHGSGDLMKALNVQVSYAKIAVARGNLPLAERMLDRTIARACEQRFNEVHGVALHDRAAVAHLQGDYERAVRLGYEALNTLSSPVARDRVLTDLAASFIVLGVRSAARDALIVLSATAQDQYSRWVATINLMELEAMEGSETRFEEHRRQLSAASLPPALEVEYCLSLGEAYRLFERPAQARLTVRRALETAATWGLNQGIFRAEQAERAIDAGERRTTAPEISVPSGVRDVANAMRQLRETAFVGS